MSPQMQPAESLVGTVLEGAYRIEGMLGEGGMGAVYAATQLRLDKRVAVKVMARELAANPEALARFHREAQITSGLGHPHIVQVFDFSTTPTGEPFLVMEFLEGEGLDHRLRRVGRLPLKDVVHIVKQVSSALAATHAKAIVHRDLKPGNIYLLGVAGEKDFVKVLDFGISKVRAASTKLTRTSSIMGTPNYMSPEQAKGNTDDIDESTDQWALACIAWECICGEGPFGGENVPSILFHIVHEPPPPLAVKLPNLAPQVEAVLVRALAKNKSERFPSVGDFAEALEAVSVGANSPTQLIIPQAAVQPKTALDTSPLPKAIPSTTFTLAVGELDEDLAPPPSASKLWRWAWVAGAAALLSLAAFLVLRPRPAPPPTVTVPSQVAPIPAAPVPTASSPSETNPEARVETELPRPAAPPPTVRAAETKQPPLPPPRPAKKRSPNKKPEENLDQWH
jgi:eukaryotic-like serine/threonine-protein kinase